MNCIASESTNTCGHERLVEDSEMNVRAFERVRGRNMLFMKGKTRIGHYNAVARWFNSTTQEGAR